MGEADVARATISAIVSVILIPLGCAKQPEDNGQPGR